MGKRRFLIVLGTRPEAVKLAPLILELKRRDPSSTFVCATGQHDEMVDQVLKIFGVTPDIKLNVMRPGQTLATVSAAILEGVDRVIAEQQPEWVVVQGDTVTASMAALCAFYRRCKIAHVEAGLRTGDLQQPFPEELNRRNIGIIATQHFAPTALSSQNLLREGVPAASVLITGNTGIDALYWMIADLQEREELTTNRQAGILRVLVTAHRRENQNGGIHNICDAIKEICAKWAGRVKVVWPVHPNPMVSSVVSKKLATIPEVTLTDPLGYEEIVRELYLADLVVTDSGGLQEEAPAFGKRVLVLRNTTERPEGVEAGVADLIGTDKDTIFRAINSALRMKAGRIACTSPYGDGKAALRIADFLMGRPAEEFCENTSSPLITSMMATVN